MDSRSVQSDRSTSSCASSNGLNDSWVELSTSTSTVAGRASGDSTPRLTKLLVEAQKESGLTSPKSSATNSTKGTLDSPPLSAHSGSSGGGGTRETIPREQLTEFIRDWSSRPEIVPPSAYGLKYEHPIKKKKHPLSVRNTAVMKEGWFSAANISTLMFTNIVSIVLGISIGWWCKGMRRTVSG